MQGVKGLVKQQKRLLQKRHAALQQARSSWQVTTSPAPWPLLCSRCCMGSLMWFCAVVQFQAGTGQLSCNNKHLSPETLRAGPPGCNWQDITLLCAL